LGKALGQSAEYWLNLQASYDLAIAVDSQNLKNIRLLPHVA
jgi:plasmid maintenance system antidote protein VapI